MKADKKKSTPYLAISMAKAAGYKQRPKRLPHGSHLDTTKQVGLNGVTEAEEHFCQVYLIEFSVKKASECVKITPSTGSVWMTKPQIKKRIAQIRMDTSKALDLTRERLLQRLMSIIYGDARTFFKDGRFIKPDKWDEDTAAMVASFNLNMLGELNSVKQHDVLKAIDTVNKMMGYNAPEVKQIITEPGMYDKAELLEIAKIMEGLI